MKRKINNDLVLGGWRLETGDWGLRNNQPTYQPVVRLQLQREWRHKRMENYVDKRIKLYGCFFPYLNSTYPRIMANEIKSSALADSEYIMRPDACSGCMSKIAANSSFCVIINSRDNSMYEPPIAPPWK